MNHKQNLKEEYIKLKSQTAPDLWDRIERGLEEKPEAENPVTIRKSSSFRLPVRALAAAACFFVCITAARILGTGTVLTPEIASETTAAEIVAAETVAAETNASEYAMAEGIVREAEPELYALSYQSLSFEPSSPVSSPESVKTVERDTYFSEDIMADTELLCEGEVKSVSFDYDTENNATAISYEIEIKQILYSQDYVTDDIVLTVKSEIDEDAVSGENILYALTENRTYLLPLAARDQDMWLVFPFAPQIEVTKNREYLFHNGWQSLVNQDSYVVLNTQAAPEDFYFDRMYLRKDQAVVETLVSLTEAMHE